MGLFSAQWTQERGALDDTLTATLNETIQSIPLASRDSFAAPHTAQHVARR